MKKHYRHENDCLNCGTILEGKFCHHCGQENLHIKENFGHMMNHAISDYFHFDHQFFHTLKPLFFRPGLLTNEYLAGRRVQYLHPIKMYIFISVVYFLLLFQGSGHEIARAAHVDGKPVVAKQIIDSVDNAIDADSDINPGQKKAVQQQVAKATNGKFNSTTSSFLTNDSTSQQYADRQAKLPPNKRDGYFARMIKNKILSYNEKYGPRAKDVFLEDFKHNIPKMMFLLLPLFALILSITFWKNRKYYVEHLIYAIHLHCFLFLFLAIIIVLEAIIPPTWAVVSWLKFLTVLYIIWYIYRSLRVVYHRGRVRTVTKMMGMSMSYVLAFSICISVVLFATALTAA